MAERSQAALGTFPGFPASWEGSISMATIIYSVNSRGDQYPSVLGLEFHQEFTHILLLRNPSSSADLRYFDYLLRFEAHLPLNVISKSAISIVE